MADPIVDNGALADIPVSADVAADGGVLQRVKLAHSLEHSKEHVKADEYGLLVQLARLLARPGGTVNSRHLLSGMELGVEDFRSPNTGMWNDGTGSFARDTEIMLFGEPSARLDTQGVAGSQASPTTTALTTPTAVAGGGTFAAGTYFWYVAGITPVGEGAKGTERSQTIAAGGHATLTWTQVDGYTGYRIYRGTSTGTETLVATVGQVGTYSDTGTAADGVTAPLTVPTAQNPARTAITTGVVAKRRIHDSFVDTFGVDVWFRLTSTNNTSGAFPSLSLYNRDGTSAWHGRLWFKPQGNNLPLDACILDGAATAAANVDPLNGAGAIYRKVDESTIQNSSGSHLYEPSTGRMDQAGGWHWGRLVVNFATKRYVSCQIDGNAPVDLSAYSLDKTTSSGFAGWHSSFEYSAATTTRRFMHIACFAISKETSL